MTYHSICTEIKVGFTRDKLSLIRFQNFHDLYLNSTRLKSVILDRSETYFLMLISEFLLPVTESKKTCVSTIEDQNFQQEILSDLLISKKSYKIPDLELIMQRSFGQ